MVTACKNYRHHIFFLASLFPNGESTFPFVTNANAYFSCFFQALRVTYENISNDLVVSKSLKFILAWCVQLNVHHTISVDVIGDPMRTSLPPACAALLMLACVFTFGCSGGAPFGAGARSKPVTTPPSTPTSPTSPTTTTTTTSPSSPSSPSDPSTPTAYVSVMISDPAACKAPNGKFSHVYITIADVQASTNPDAAAGDSSFVDLTPGLSSAPQQVDLLGQPNSKCFLSSLSVSQQVLTGNYQQIRIFLAPDSAASSVQNNACGASYSNCLVLNDNSLHDLALPAASAKGIELSTAQLVGGGLSLSAGDQPAIDLNFDICSSILAAANGGYEFNPIMYAGLIPSTGGSISGQVVSSETGNALKGGQVVVALEQKDSKTGIDRILMRTVANSAGNFVLCPVPRGTYDVVALGVDGSNVSYSAGVETGIQNGQMAGKIPLVPGSAQGTLNGMVTTQNASLPPAGVPVAVRASALEQIAGGTTITVPLLPSQSLYNSAMLTTSNGSCPAGVDCSSFALQLPAVTPNVVACSEETAPFKQQQGSAPTYIAESFAQIPGSGNIPDCISSDLSVSSTLQGHSIVLNPDQNSTASTLAFTRCE